MLAKTSHDCNPHDWEELHGNFGQLALKREEGKEELLQSWSLSPHPHPPHFVKPAGILCGLDMPNLTCLHCSMRNSITGFSWAGLLGSVWSHCGRCKLAWCLAGRENSLMLGVGEVEQASVERLNNCINISGSPRRHAYTARGHGLGRCEEALKLPSLPLSSKD